MIQEATPNLQTARIFAAIMILTLIALLLFGLVSLLERVLVPWAPRGKVDVESEAWRTRREARGQPTGPDRKDWSRWTDLAPTAAVIVALLSVVAIVAAACSKSATPASSGPTGAGLGSPARGGDRTSTWSWTGSRTPTTSACTTPRTRAISPTQNLTVTFHPPSNAADPIKLVGLNKVDLAISYEPEMFYGQQEKLPVIAVATVVPVPLNSLIVAPGESRRRTSPR